MFCRYCGSQQADDAKYCESCGKSLDVEDAATEAPDEVKPNVPPVAVSETPVANAPEGEIIAGQRVARMGDRLIALILDTVLVAAFFAVFGMWYSIGREGITGSGFSLSGAPAMIVMLVCLGAGLLYYWLLEGLFGATIGKTIAGIRVLKTDGSRCGLRGSLVRNLLRIVDGIAVYLVGLLVAVFSKQRRRIGDYVAGTLVVEHQAHKAIRGIAVVLWLALIAGGVTGAILIHRQAPGVEPTVAGVAPSTAAAETPSVTETAPAAGAEASAGGTLANLRIASTGAMKVTHFDFLEKEGGPSRPYAPYAPGDVVYIEYGIGEFARDSDSRMKVNLEAVTNDPNGLPLHSAWTRLMSQSSDGSPLNGSYSTTIPVFAPAGSFEFKLNAEDQIGESKLELSEIVVVDAAPIEPADALEIRDFALSLTKGGEAASPLVLHGGGTVHMRCKLFGIELRNDASDIQMAFKVTGPKGDILLDKPDFLHDRDTYIYHPPAFYLPITGNLNIPAGADKGTYTLEYTARDNLGDSEVTRRGTVEVR